MMSQKVNSEVENQKVVKLHQWSDLEDSELLELLALSSDIDPEFYQVAIKQAPLMMKETKKARKNTYKNAKLAMKLSRSTKKYYLKVSKAILKLLKNNEIADELKGELLILLKEITLKMEQADIRDKEFLASHQSKTIGYSALALLAVAALYGVKAIQKD